MSSQVLGITERVRLASALARFHWSSARLHPFAFANQSVAMSLVNHALRRARGAGMPQHVLDHLALRLSGRAYEQVFDAAVTGWLVRDESPVRRILELARRKRRAFDLLRALEGAESLAAAERECGAKSSGREERGAIARWLTCRASLARPRLVGREVAAHRTRCETRVQLRPSPTRQANGTTVACAARHG